MYFFSWQVLSWRVDKLFVLFCWRVWSWQVDKLFIFLSILLFVLLSLLFYQATRLLLTRLLVYYTNNISTSKAIKDFFNPLSWTTQSVSPKRRKFRAISSARLWHRCLYTCTLSTSSSSTTLNGVLILRLASHLDAFSAYPFQTQIPSGAPGGTTGKPEVCPSRSSRTSDGTTQNSRAHDR